MDHRRLAQVEADEFRLDRVGVGDVRIVSIHGCCDLISAAELRDALTGELEGEDGRKLVVDLSRATVFDSTCLGVMVLAHRAARSCSGALVVVAGNPAIARPFQVAGLDRLVPLFASRSEALAALREPMNGRVG